MAKPFSETGTCSWDVDLGVNTPFELLQKSNEFTLKGIANMIGRPTLDLEAQEDDSFLGQPKMIYDALTYTKK
jgi:hypothetical protein